MHHIPIEIGTLVSILVIAKFATRYTLRMPLQEQGYIVREAETLHEGLHKLSMTQVDLIIHEMPGNETKGLNSIKRLHRTTQIPIIALSRHTDITLKVAALDAGADDYLVVPYDLVELLARLRVALRYRRLIPKDNLLTVGDLTLNLVNRRVSVAGGEVHLTLTEYRLLYMLASFADETVTYEQLLSYAWGQSDNNELKSLRTVMSTLRKKLESKSLNSHYIVTSHNTGYSLRPTK